MRRLSIFCAALLSCAACSAEVVLGAFAPGADAGVADLELSFDSPWIHDVDGGSFLAAATLKNLGAQPARDARINLSWEAEVGFGSSAACMELASGAECALGTLDAGTSAQVSASVRLGALPRWFELTARGSTGSPETEIANNYARIPIALTPGGTAAIPISAERVLTVNFCFGAAKRSFSECMPGPTTLTANISLHTDAGMEDTVGVHGFWGQSPHQRNLAFRFVNTDGTKGASYVGGSVTPTCFEGLFDDSSGAAVSGAWRGCLN